MEQASAVETLCDVVALGSAMVEITPSEMGRPLSDVEGMTPLPSGAASNFASVLASLDVRVELMSRVGDDELGRWLVDRLGGRNIGTRFVDTVAGQLTPVSLAWMDQGGAKTFYFYRFPGYSDPLATLTASEITSEQAAAGRIFDFSEAAIRSEPLRSAALRAARLATEASREVCFAVNYRPSAWRGTSEDDTAEILRTACGAAHIVAMNRDEAQFVTGRAEVADALEDLKAMGPTLIAVTAGDEGAWVLAEGSTIEVPPRRVNVLYDIGAGDTFHAGLLAAHLAGMHAERAARFASDAAALRISRAAAAPSPTFDEITALGDKRF
ncbi:MAG: hypothetical protein GX131_01125 [candidate division WS1 bacterium]|nr:hypothetical protein [candidate division WS1 bacterium]